eukprot:TRINITY_DN12149_c0_g1_i3.p1 TRINITY_DN12149_c0_g1~~TRINITY_DN12149_c0_g1_i3.p1  ORF type:complete len:206 (+),score=58.12 TRINITY_DN12149_c0_g1_i3:172-789(+)
MEHCKGCGASGVQYVEIGRTGTGVACFMKEADAQNAIQLLNGSIFELQALEVHGWKKRTDPIDGNWVMNPAKTYPPARKVFIGGLPVLGQGLSDDLNKKLKELCNSAGNCEYAEIGRTGTGVACFRKDQDAHNAVVFLNGKDFEGHTLEMKMWRFDPYAGTKGKGKGDKPPKRRSKNELLKKAEYKERKRQEMEEKAKAEAEDAS